MSVLTRFPSRAPARSMRDAVSAVLFGVTGQPLMPVLSLASLLLLAYMDIAAGNVLAPDIRDTFHFSDVAVTGIAGLAGFTAVIAALPFGYLGDRFSRVNLTVLLALVLGFASLVSGLTPVSAIFLFVLARMATGIGEVSNGPIHQSLLADYHPPNVRPRAFGLQRVGYPLGLILGSYVAGQLAHAFNWRVAFVALAFPAFGLAFLAGFLRDPLRGAFEGLGERSSQLPGFAVTMRRLWQIGTLRRVWIGAFLTAGSVPLTSTLIGLFLNDVFHLGDVQRGWAGTANGLGLFLGLAAGGFMAQRLHRRTIAGQIFYSGAAIAAAGITVVCAALAHRTFLGVPGFWAITFLTVSAFFNGLYYPGLFQVLALVCPPRIRSTGLAGGALFLGFGALIYSIVAGQVADAHGLPAALILLGCGIAIGGAVIASGAGTAYDDAVSAAQANVVASEQVRPEGDGTARPVVHALNLEFAYAGNQVLFGTTLEIFEGETLALLGTNGAGKSTLLKLVAGIETPARGAVFYRGEDVTGSPPEDLARRGLILVPGGRAVFAGLSVRENLRLATWIYRKDRRASKAAIEQALTLFPRLAQRLDQPAAVLSGGERQMLGLAQGLVCQPRLLMIDELTLGLAPKVVEELIGVVTRLKAEGMTMVLVEQSVNIASLVCERAYFMEKGQVRYTGSPRALLERPDLLRSIFLGSAVAV